MTKASPFFTTEFADFQGLKFVTVKSNALKKRADLTFFVPQNLKPGVRVVILLHGVYGSHWAWAIKGRAHETAQRLIHEGKIEPAVLVMPSDGLFADGSGYLPHQTENYERWIVEDVLQVVQALVPEVNNDSSFFIAGLSMGGYGAMRLGAKYPAIFKGFSGLSSITHFEQMRAFVSDFEDLQAKALEQDGVLDWMLKNKNALPPFRFDCGSADILIEHNRSLHHRLVEQGIPHVYEEFEGGHSWEYWAKHLEETLLFFQKI
jgi:enterochelin esterase-like enzyme